MTGERFTTLERAVQQPNLLYREHPADPSNGESVPGRTHAANPSGNLRSFPPDETLHTIACAFGDIDPLAVAQANRISIDSALYVGQQLNIP